MFDIKAFFGSLAGRSSGQNAAVASVTQLVQNLPEAEFYSTFIEIIKAVARLNADVEVELAERVQALLYVDEKAHGFHEKICGDLMSNSGRPQSYLPSVLSYLGELSNGYQICIRQSQRSKTAPSDEIKLCTLRALQHQLDLVKWSALRYLSAEGAAWQQAYHLYAFAEAQGFAREAIRPYPKRHPACCEGMVIRAGMLHLAQTDNLLPQEIEGVDRLLQTLSEGVHLHAEPGSIEFQYVINLERPQPPQLLRRGTTGKGCRYWSGEMVLNHLADLMLAFDQKTPDNLRAAVPQMDKHAWQALMDKLATRWSQDGGKSMRRHERTMTYTHSQVEVGLERIALSLKIGRSATPPAASAQWKINDISPTGVGLIYLGRDIEHLKIGRLLWLSSEAQPGLLCVTRRIQRLAEGGTRVGVEIIAENPLVVGLSDPTSDASAQTLSALYVTQANARSGERMLLIPQQLSDAGRALIFSANGKAYQIRIKACSACYEEAAQVEFETLERVAS